MTCSMARIQEAFFEAVESFFWGGSLGCGAREGIVKDRGNLWDVVQGRCQV
jgi:hypothetical protein